MKNVAERDTKTEALAGAFASFEGASRALSGAYERLEQQFRRVNRELERANRDLANSLLETEQTRRLLDNVFSSVSCGILSCDLGGIVTTANPALTAMLGRPEGSLQGMRYDEVLGGWAELAPHLDGEGRRGGPVVTRSRLLERDDGAEIHVESTVSRLVSTEGAPVGLVEVVTDLTEVKRLEEEVREARTLAALGEMAAGLAHEIRNPLGGIKGFASLLARDSRGDDSRSRILEQMTGGIDALNRIVTDFLAFGEPGRPAPRLFDARDLTTEVLALLEAEGLSDGIDVVCEAKAEAALAFADRDHVGQIVHNLMRNAFEATPSGGRVSVRIVQAAARVEIQVRDSGPGIPAAVRERLFRPFGSTKDGGSGLGLAVAKKLAESNGAQVRIASDAHGTLATLGLPAPPADVDLRGGCA